MTWRYRYLAFALTLAVRPMSLGGQPVTAGPEFQANTYTTGHQGDPTVAAGPTGGFVVVWAGPDGSYNGGFGQRYDSTGSPIGGEFQLNAHTTGYQFFQGNAVAVDPSGGFVVVWTADDGRDGSGYAVFGRRFDSNGAPLGSDFQVNTYTTGDQIVKFDGIATDPTGGFVVVWHSEGGQDGSLSSVAGRRYDSNGTPLGGEFQVNTYTTGSQVGPVVAVGPTGDFVVLWSDFGGQDGSNLGVFGRRYDSNGVPRRWCSPAACADPVPCTWW